MEIPTLQTPSNQTEAVTVLLISPRPESQASLRRIFGHSNWLFHGVSACDEALALLRGNDATVVIWEHDVPDGDWKLVLNRLESLPIPPNLIVTSLLTHGELWAEVFNLGGYDVLTQPFDAREVYRVVFLAWHAQKRRVQAAADRNGKPEAARTKSPAAA